MSYQTELYQKVILEHNRNPRNFRALEDPTHSCVGYNPLCGDKFTVYLKVRDDRLEEVSFLGSGCAISKASASLMTTFLKGRSLKEARILFEEFRRMIVGELDPGTDENRLGKLSVFVGVRDYPSRAKCATLAWHTLIGSLEGKGEASSE